MRPGSVAGHSSIRSLEPRGSRAASAALHAVFISPGYHSERRTPPWQTLSSVYGQHRPLLLEGGRQWRGAPQPCLKRQPLSTQCTAPLRIRRPSRKPRPERHLQCAAESREKQSEAAIMVNARASTGNASPSCAAPPSRPLLPPMPAPRGTVTHRAADLQTDESKFCSDMRD